MTAISAAGTFQRSGVKAYYVEATHMQMMAASAMKKREVAVIFSSTKGGEGYFANCGTGKAERSIFDLYYHL